MWIEILRSLTNYGILIVTSLAEVWIEILILIGTMYIVNVTSLAEVWIEIKNNDYTDRILCGHFPCGSVD